MSDAQRQAIIVLGMSGAGKTTYSNGLEVPAVAFDSIHNYGTGTTDYPTLWGWVLENLAHPVIVVDGWKLNDDPDLAFFRSICGFAGRNIEVRVIYTSPVELCLAQRRKEKARDYEIYQGKRELRKHAAAWQSLSVTFTKAFVAPLLDQGFRVRYLERQGSQYHEHPDYSHLCELAASDPVVELLAWIDAQSHDPNYQTIELDGETIRAGYTESEDSWERIQKWGLDWRNKVVGDAGCFNGYFCFKAEEAGASQVTGYDRGEGPLAVASRLAELRGSCCLFVRKDLASDPIEEPMDMCLVMNSLHHIAPDPYGKAGEHFLGQVFQCSQEVIFEIERNTEDPVTKKGLSAGFMLAHDAESHRVTDTGPRRLLHFTRMRQ